MTRHRWTATMPADELGAVVHGPLLLARVGGGSGPDATAEGTADGIAVGLRCVHAHPGGLALPVVLVAVGVYGEAAGRQRWHTADPLGHPAGSALPYSQLILVADVGGRSGEVLPHAETSSGSPDEYRQDTNFWIDALPGPDETIRLTVSWARIGLPETTTVIRLPGVHAAATTAISLLP